MTTENLTSEKVLNALRASQWNARRAAVRLGVGKGVVARFADRLRREGHEIPRRPETAMPTCMPVEERPLPRLSDAEQIARIARTLHAEPSPEMPAWVRAAWARAWEAVRVAVATTAHNERLQLWEMGVSLRGETHAVMDREDLADLVAKKHAPKVAQVMAAPGHDDEVRVVAWSSDGALWVGGVRVVGVSRPRPTCPTRMPGEESSPC